MILFTNDTVSISESAMEKMMSLNNYRSNKDSDMIVIPHYLDEHTTVMTVKMQNKTSITNFVLSFGNNCEVIEPQWLKDEILKKVQEISSIYQEHN